MTFYIYYQPATGNILAVANEQDSSFGEQFIETDLETYEKFGTGEYKVHEWAVLSSPKDDTVVELVKRVQETKEFDPDKSIKQIEKTKVQPKNAFIIKQNTKSGKWQIKTTLDDKHLIYYAQTDGYANQAKEIFVIAEDNPTVLLDTFVIEFKDLLTKNTYDVKLYNKDIAKRTDISLICSRVDEEYVHIVS
jgi:hypothetical protein